MSDPPDPGPDDGVLEQLAASVLAGEPVNWSAAATRVSDSRHGLVDQLRALAAITRFYEQLQHADDEAPPLVEGARWGPLQIEGLIGAGSYGEVYRAWDTRLGRRVALKLLKRAAALPASHTSTLIAEAHRLARVRHPHVVAVHGAELIDGRVGLWMELVDGETLAARLAREGCLPLDEVSRIGRALAEALGAVHAAGLVHGDVKADNVMCDAEGRYVLMDFGAGTDVWVGTDTPEPAVLTPRYAAPEVRAGAPPTRAADFYSLGVLLHVLATGVFPDGGPPGSGAPTASARRRLSAMPRALAIVTRLLDPIPARRPASASDVARALVPAPARRQRTAIWMLGLTALVAAALVWTDRQRPDAPVLPASPPLPSVQRLPAPPYRLIGRPARDVPFLSFVEPDGHLSLLDLRTFAVRRVIDATPDEWVEFSALSPDGTRVAYQWRRADDLFDLRVDDVTDGRTGRRVLANAQRYPIPLDWTADGRSLLVLSHQADGTRVLEIRTIADGTVIPIHTFTTSVPYAATVSPDGRHVAYDVLPPGKTDRDIWIADVATRQTWPVATHTASDALPTWSTDGRNIFFVSDRAGSPDGWLQDVRNGRPTGEPRVAARHLGRVSPLGFTTGHDYIYLAQTGLIEAFTATVDLRAGSAEPPRRLPSRFEGRTAQPAWSPDGQRLAYLALVGPIRGDRGGHVLVVRDVATGEERILAGHLSFFLPRLIWTPDGRHVVLRATDSTNRPGLFRVDAETGEASAIEIEAVPAPPQYLFASTGDLLYVDMQGSTVTRRSADGATTVVLSKEAAGVRAIIKIVLSPDDSAVLYSGFDARTGTSVVRVAETSGKVVELARAGDGEQLVPQAWTPDGTGVLFTRWRPGTSEPHALWLAGRDGTGARALGLDIPGWTQANGVSVHPDGTAIAFTAGDVSWSLSRLTQLFAPPAGGPRFSP